MSNWNWKVVRQFLKQSFDLGLSRSSCLNYLHRLGFVLKRNDHRHFVEHLVAIWNAIFSKRSMPIRERRFLSEAEKLICDGRNCCMGR